MVKHYYIQHYPQNVRCNTARDKNNSLGFHQAVNQEQSNQAREKTQRSDKWTCGESRCLSQVVNLNRVRK